MQGSLQAVLIFSKLEDTQGTAQAPACFQDPKTGGESACWRLPSQGTGWILSPG